MTQQHSIFFKRWISYAVITSMLAMGFPMQAAFAGIVETDQVASTATALQDRATINSFLDRKDVIEQLQHQGISVGEAKARVSALTDNEAHKMAGKLDQLPAGGDIVGTVVFVFLVLLITDILGFTKVFPFTRTIQR